jgi:hypothetical protein
MHLRGIPFFLIALTSLALLPEEIQAGRQTRTSSSWGSSSRSSTSTRSTTRSSWGGSGWGSSRTTRTTWVGSSSTPSSNRSSSKTTRSSWGSSRRTSSSVRVSRPANASEADQKAYEKAVQVNSFNKRSTSYASPQQARDAAIADFNKKWGKQYPSTYKEKPKERPAHIPETYMVRDTGGKEHPAKVEYQVHNGVGGYYYRDAAGALVLYSLMKDRHRRDEYLYRRGYDPSGRAYVRSSHSGNAAVWMIMGIAIVVLLVLGAVLAASFFFASQKGPPPRRGRNRKPRPAPAKKQQKERDRLREPIEAAYWVRARPGDMLILRDQQTLEMLMEAGRSDFAHGVSLTIKRVRRIQERNKLMQWTLCELEPIRIGNQTQVWFLVAKVVDEAFDVRVMFEPADFEPGSREHLLEAGCQWLFQPPENEDNFNPADLRFTLSIDKTVDGNRVVGFHQKGQGVLYGEQYEEPRPSGVPQPQFVTLVEYQADTAYENPELLLLEVGGVDRSRPGQRFRGGFITMYEGANVSPNDLELMLT